MLRFAGNLALALCVCSLMGCSSSAEEPSRAEQTAKSQFPEPAAGSGEAGAKASHDREESTDDETSLAIFEKRILPILNAERPSSCAECHLSGVDLKDYIRPDQAKTFAALVSAGMVDIERPDDSKLLAFIRRRPEQPNLLSDRVRQQEYQAFRAWIRAAVADPTLLAAKSQQALGPTVPKEVIRHARTDRVLASFVDNIWSEVGRCAGCHSPDQNQQQVEKYGEQVSWIKRQDPQGTMDYLIAAELIDLQAPEDSMILLKPTMQVEHGGGQKMLIGDRTYRQFRRFIDDYAAIATSRYRAAEDLPQPSDEVSVATSMTNGIWFKLEDVPARYDKKLLQVDLYRREGDGWSGARWATADRAVAGDQHLWQQTLSLTAPRDSARAKEIFRNQSLPAGEYLAKVYIDVDGKLSQESQTGLGEPELVGHVIVNSEWRKGYGKMTVVRFPRSEADRD